MQGQVYPYSDDRQQILKGHNQHPSQNLMNTMQTLLSSNTLSSELEFIRKTIDQTDTFTFGDNLISNEIWNSAYLNASGLAMNSYQLKSLQPDFTQIPNMLSCFPGNSYSNKIAEYVDPRYLYYNSNRLNSNLTSAYNYSILSKLSRHLEIKGNTNQFGSPETGSTWDDHNTDNSSKQYTHQEKMEEKVAQHKVKTKIKKKSQKLKIKDKPKRPLSAYNLFFKDERESILSEIPDTVKEVHIHSNTRGNRKIPHRKIGFESLAKEIGQRWHSLDSLRVEHYKMMASLEMKRYLQEMKIFRKKQAMNGDIIAASKSDLNYDMGKSHIEE
jgi:hypothetical protein